MGMRLDHSHRRGRGLAGQQSQHSDRAAAEDNDPIVGQHAARRFPDTVIADRDRLDQGGLFVAQIVRDPVEARLLCRAVFGHSARRLPAESVILDIEAGNRRQAPFAVGADAAGLGNFADDAVADGELRDLAAGLHDLAGPLVAGNKGKGALQVGAAPHVHICGADAAGRDAHEDLVRGRTRDRQLLYSQVVDIPQDRRFHYSAS